MKEMAIGSSEAKRMYIYKTYPPSFSAPVSGILLMGNVKYLIPDISLCSAVKIKCFMVGFNLKE